MEIARSLLKHGADIEVPAAEVVFTDCILLCTHYMLLYITLRMGGLL